MCSPLSLSQESLFSLAKKNSLVNILISDFLEAYREISQGRISKSGRAAFGLLENSPSSAGTEPMKLVKTLAGVPHNVAWDKDEKITPEVWLL